MLIDDNVESYKESIIRWIKGLSEVERFNIFIIVDRVITMNVIKMIWKDPQNIKVFSEVEKDKIFFMRKGYESVLLNEQNRLRLDAER